MDMLIDGEYVSDMDYENVINPYDGEVIDKVPISHLNNVDRAIEAANNAKQKFMALILEILKGL